MGAFLTHLFACVVIVGGVVMLDPLKDEPFTVNFPGCVERPAQQVLVPVFPILLGHFPACIVPSITIFPLHRRASSNAVTDRNARRDMIKAALDLIFPVTIRPIDRDYIKLRAKPEGKPKLFGSRFQQGRFISATGY